MRRQRASVLRRKWGEECGGHLTCTSNKGSALPCLLSSLLSALFQSRTERLHFRQVSIVECQEEWSIDSAEFRATQTLLISLLTKGGGSAPKTFKQSHRQPASALKEVDRRAVRHGAMVASGSFCDEANFNEGPFSFSMMSIRRSIRRAARGAYMYRTTGSRSTYAGFILGCWRLQSFDAALAASY